MSPTPVSVGAATGLNFCDHRDMARVLQMPLSHPARVKDPFQLRRAPATTYGCPFNCGEKFNHYWELHAHLLQHHMGNASLRPTK